MLYVVWSVMVSGYCRSARGAFKEAQAAEVLKECQILDIDRFW
jgi:hypothetical protein